MAKLVAEATGKAVAVADDLVVGALLRLAEKLSAPATVQKQIKDLTAVSEKARAESAALAKLRKDTAADLADARAQHAARIERELKDHEQAMTAARVELAAVEKQAADLLAKAKSDAAAAAKAKATAERKLAAFEAS
jgi:colicin import membrane protein